MEGTQELGEGGSGDSLVAGHGRFDDTAERGIGFSRFRRSVQSADFGLVQLSFLFLRFEANSF